YGLPLSIARKDDVTFYFHCAPEGEKIDVLRLNPFVSLSAVSKCTPKFEAEKGNFTEYYHSAIANGRVEEVIENDEKIDALRLICQRFLPKEMSHFKSAIQRSLHRTAIFRIILTEPPVGKSKP
ncbi:MAG: pyridoxamine 5'-phosphate oxidase family protein, partial [Muribaculaceae bacterium]|nr:pyridoxamine 5'-phosphate oxidase family protein [Muribaculaceae bacterium]